MSWTGSSDVTPLFRPLAGSGCLPNTLRCSDWDVARQPHHPCCCSASGTQVGAYVDLTLKERQCWGVEGGLWGTKGEGRGLTWITATTRQETLRGTVRLALYLQPQAWCLSGSAASQQHNAVILLKNPDCFVYFLGQSKMGVLDRLVCTVCVKQSKSWTIQQESQPNVAG